MGNVLFPRMGDKVLTARKNMMRSTKTTSAQWKKFLNQKGL